MWVSNFSVVIVAGDFSAHLGCLGGPKGIGEPNQSGLIVKDFIDRCSLHILSRSEGQNLWHDYVNYH